MSSFEHGTTTGPWDDPSGRIHRGEFECPWAIEREVIRAIGHTRMLLGKPINLTKPFHPNGDAVPYNAKSHSEFSLHRIGINHSESYRKKRLIPDPNQLGVALDWDCGDADADELFGTYLDLVREGLWTGIGAYPHWHRPGFHTDLRGEDHPSCDYHWVRDAAGGYHQLTWKNYKKAANMSVMVTI